MNRCLHCYQPLEDTSVEFHQKCSKKFFGHPIPPTLELSKESMEEMARQIVSKRIVVAGVQPKLSLSLDKNPDDPQKLRFTIVGLWGDYILKPPTTEFPLLPEIEDVSMHLARIAKIKTAEHSLIRLESGELAYLTKRFDRVNKKKIPLEDFCQLSGLLTEDKYKGSMERTGKIIRDLSTQPGIDSINFFELTLFLFLTGNADMHLKNFSLMRTEHGEIILSSAYDLVSTALAMPEDKEELALTLNGKKSRLKKNDFDALAMHLQLNPKMVDSTYKRFASHIPKFYSFIDMSFLPEELKLSYKNLIMERGRRIGMLS